MPKVLIIDDEKALLDNLTAYLEDEGYEVDTSVTAESGLSKLNTFLPDAVIVDLRLQGINGETFIKTAHAINSDIQFIIHTGSREYEVPEDLYKLGFNNNHLIYKPISDLSQLSDLLKHLINGAKNAINH